MFFFIVLRNPTCQLIKRPWINSFIFYFPKISTWPISLSTVLSIFSPLDKLIGYPNVNGSVPYPNSFSFEDFRCDEWSYLLLFAYSLCLEEVLRYNYCL